MVMPLPPEYILKRAGSVVYDDRRACSRIICMDRDAYSESIVTSTRWFWRSSVCAIRLMSSAEMLSTSWQ